METLRTEHCLCLRKVNAPDMSDKDGRLQEVVQAITNAHTDTQQLVVNKPSGIRRRPTDKSGRGSGDISYRGHKTNGQVNRWSRLIHGVRPVPPLNHPGDKTLPLNLRLNFSLYVQYGPREIHHVWIDLDAS